MRKSISFRKGNVFAAAGFGRYGPYALGNVRLNRTTSVKGSVGTLGKIIGAKYGNRRNNIIVQHNVTTQKTGIKGKLGKFRFSL